MESCPDLNIDTIYTVIYKEELPYFRFDNPGRDWDGFVLFTDGAARFTLAGQESRLCEKGTLLLLRKGDCYSLFSPDGCAYITSAFDFSPPHTQSLSLLPAMIPCPDSLYAGIVEMAKKWQLQLWDSRLRCRIGILELYTELLRRCRHSRGRTANTLMDAATDYIHRNFRKNFSARQIAEYCSVSPSYLRTRFRESTGQTITAYREELRINAAKQMLQSGLFSVKETALELGYCDVYYFSKCFSAATGVTPARFSGRRSAG